MLPVELPSPPLEELFVGHSYFAQAEALLYEIGNLMRRDEDPAKRQRIAAEEHEGLKLWRLRL